MESKKEFIIIGRKDAVTYKELFPLLRDNRLWLGPGFPNGNAYFRIASDTVREFAAGVYDEAAGLVKFRNVGWFTNIDHGGRHEPLILDTMAHNIKFNKKLVNKLKNDYLADNYPKIDNFDALEVPFVECIPSDYFDMMAVPTTFFDRYNPEQFEIIGITKTWDGLATKTYEKQIQVNKDGKKSLVTKLNDGAAIMVDSPPNNKTYYIIGGTNYVQTYPRILIRPKKGGSTQ